MAEEKGQEKEELVPLQCRSQGHLVPVTAEGTQPAPLSWESPCTS